VRIDETLRIAATGGTFLILSTNATPLPTRFARRRRNIDPDEEIVVPPSTLAVDIGGALGESEYADIKFVANGKPIYAHRCILAARSSYFSSMFRSIEMSGGKKNKVVEVVVPDR
jgi:hypothetical protein